MKTILPVQLFNSSVILHDSVAETMHERALGRPLASLNTREAVLCEIFRRRYWYYIRIGRRNAACPGHQQAVKKLHFDVLDDPHLNAAATTVDQYNLIGLNAGAVVNVCAFFNALLSHPSILPDYGFPSQEVEAVGSMRDCDWRQPIRAVATAAIPPMDLSEGGPKPNHWLRGCTADTLAAMALDFVFFHELTHLRRGHLHFLKVEAGATKIDETRGEGSAEIRRAKQVFELDADGGAMEITLGPWLAGKHVKGFEAGEAGPEQAIEMWAFSIALLFALFDPFPQPVAAYRELDHPHPMVRLASLYIQAGHIARGHSSEALGLFQDAWWNALESVGRITQVLDLYSSVYYSVITESMTDTIAEQQGLAGHLRDLVDAHDSLRI